MKNVQPASNVKTVDRPKMVYVLVTILQKNGNSFNHVNVIPISGHSEYNEYYLNCIKPNKLTGEYAVNITSYYYSTAKTLTV